MTDQERAMSAADYLNSGNKWRCNNVTADYPRGCCGEPGAWTVYRKPESAIYTVTMSFLSHAELIDLAEQEGWEG